MRAIKSVESIKKEQKQKQEEADLQYASLVSENKLLKAQLTASSDRQDFLEDCIAEMAMMVYDV